MVLLALLALGAAGCDRHEGPVPIRLGTPCSSCGMEIQDLSFACEVARPGSVRVYDSIECLLRDAPVRGAVPYLADYDSRSLHPADSLWIVKGRFPSPMGGGLASFTRLEAAEEVAQRSHGHVGRWSAARELLVAAP
jgi:nitrous oxide reductase accessory protein NosL